MSGHFLPCTHSCLLKEDREERRGRFNLNLKRTKDYGWHVALKQKLKIPLTRSTVVQQWLNKAPAPPGSIPWYLPVYLLICFSKPCIFVSCILILEHLLCILILEHLSCILILEHLLCAFILEHLSCILILEHLLCVLILEHLSCILILEHLSCNFILEHLSCILILEHLLCVLILEHLSCILILEHLSCNFILEHLSCISILEHLSCILSLEHFKLILSEGICPTRLSLSLNSTDFPADLFYSSGEIVPFPFNETIVIDNFLTAQEWQRFFSPESRLLLQISGLWALDRFAEAWLLSSPSKSTNLARRPLLHRTNTKPHRTNTNKENILLKEFEGHWYWYIIT